MSKHSKIEIDKIISQLNKFPKTTQVAICLRLAKLVLPYWENYFDKQEENLNIFRKKIVRQAIDISERWIQSRDDSILMKAEIVSNQIWEDMERVSFFCQETSGNAEEVKNRNKAFSSIECVYQTIQCVLWTERKVEKEFAQKEFTNELNQLISDAIEKEARKNNGAIFEVSQAIHSARFVIENDELILKEIKSQLDGFV